MTPSFRAVALLELVEELRRILSVHSKVLQPRAAARRKGDDCAVLQAPACDKWPAPGGGADPCSDVTFNTGAGSAELPALARARVAALHSVRFAGPRTGAPMVPTLRIRDGPAAAPPAPRLTRAR